MRQIVTALGIVIGLAACKKAAPEQVPAPRDPPPSEPAPSDAAVSPVPADASPATPRNCNRLSRTECLESDHCTLVLAGSNVYRCRDDEGVCEVGIRQGDRAACEAKPECAWNTGTCYCPCEGAARTLTVEEPQTGCACACGGGEPARCLEKSKLPPAT